MLNNFLKLMHWIGEHPGEFAGAVILAWMTATVLAVIVMWRIERRERLEMERQLTADKLRLVNPQPAPSPRAAGLKSTRVGKAWLVLVGALLWPVSAYAGPITASHGGCVDGSPGLVATWTAPVHMRHTALWSQAAGCHATGDDYIEVGYLIEYVILEDGTSQLQFFSDRLREMCGRFQIDAQLGDVVSALMIDTGVSCTRRGPVGNQPSDSLASGGPFPETLGLAAPPAGDPPAVTYPPKPSPIAIDIRPRRKPPVDDAPTPTQHSVPDGGSTMGLLGIGMAFISLASRRVLRRAA